MPTVLRQEGFRVMIYVDDHPPAHVHIWKAGGELVVNLGDENTVPFVRDNFAVSRKDERRALEIIGDHQAELLEEWRRIHG